MVPFELACFFLEVVQVYYLKPILVLGILLVFALVLALVLALVFALVLALVLALVFALVLAPAEPEYH